MLYKYVISIVAIIILVCTGISGVFILSVFLGIIYLVYRCFYHSKILDKKGEN